MELARAGGGGGRSSSVELSSPLSEPSEHPPSYSTPPPHNPLQSAGDAPNSTIRVGGIRDFDDAASRPPLTSATSQSAAAPTIGIGGGTSHTSITGSLQLHPPPKEKKPRKKREPHPDKKDPPLRKPRTSAITAASRRKAKPDAANPAAEVSVASAPRQSKISDLITPHTQTAPATPFVDAPAPSPNSRLGFTMQNEAVQNSLPVYPQMQPRPPQQQQQPQPNPSPPRTSGLNYDPVRSMTISAPSTPNLPTKQPLDANPSGPVFHASASPAISSLTEPQPPNTQSLTPQFSSPTQILPPPSYQQLLSGPASMPVTAPVEQTSKPSLGVVEHPSKIADASAMDLDTTSLAPTSKPAAPAKKSSSSTPSNAEHSPAPRAKPAPAPPPLAQGSGLLSSAMLGGETVKDTHASSTNEAPDIILHVDLKGKSNVIINFAREAEKKYGFEALYPRLAKIRARLAKVAEAGEALEKAANGGKLGGTSAEESGDEDMSVDIDRDSDNDGDIAMSGLNGGTGTGANSETDGKGVKKKRRRKVEEYDQDDDFVDDSELAWEQQAAASKDGFFVYCGPLVPEGEKPALDQPGGESRRGRGGGRGRGRGRGASTAAGATGEAGGRGVGPSSRGGGATRKPRVTKAGKAVLDRERQEREKMAPLAAKPSGYPA